MNVIRAAQNMIVMLEKSDHEDALESPERRPDGKGVRHAKFLLEHITEELVTGEKAHRWLAWAQCILTYEGVTDLEACKYANLFS
jgi:hypothetical protein